MVRFKFYWMLIVICFCLSGLAPVCAETGDVLTKDELMHQLAGQGYAWGDLLTADQLATRYSVPLQTLLKLRPAGYSWQQVEAALIQMESARVTTEDPVKRNNDPTILSLYSNGFSADEIGLMAYQATLYNNSFATIAKVAIQELPNVVSLNSENDFDLMLAADNSASSVGSCTIEDPGMGYDTGKCAPFSTVIGNGSEKVDPQTGFLERSETDLILPGKNGLDFVLTRVYKSEKSELQKIRLSYDPNLDEIVPSLYGSNYLDELYHLGAGWGFDLPSIEEGNYLHIGSSTYKIDTENTCLEGVTTQEYTLTTDAFGNYVLKHKSGVDYYFTTTGKLSRVQNQYGNTITYTWIERDSKYYLDNVIDTFKKKITFDYQPNLVTITMESAPGTTPYIIKYLKEQLNAGGRQLAQVTYPEATTVKYAYARTACNFYATGSGRTGTRDYLLLQSATNPYQGQCTYTYKPSERQLDAGAITETFQRVATRSDLVNGQTQNYIAYDFTTVTPAVPEGQAPVIEHYATIYYGGMTNWARKEILHYNKDDQNNKTEIYLADQSDYCETITTTFSDKLPISTQVTISNSRNGQTTTTTTNTSYNQFADVTKATDSEGHYTESSYKTITRPDNGRKLQVVEWTKQQLSEVGSGSTEYVITNYTYDSYGNVTSVEEQELNARFAQVTEDVIATERQQEMFASHDTFNKVLPAKAKNVTLNIYFYAGLFCNVADYEVRYWEVGQARPAGYYWKSQHQGKWFSSAYGYETVSITVPDAAKTYQVEVLATKVGSFGSKVTVRNVNVTYDKAFFDTPVTQAKTYYLYANPTTCGQPQEMHKEFGNGGVAHSASFGSDGCIKTVYEYQASAVENPVSTEDYTNGFLSKLTEYVTDVDGVAQTLITEARYNRFGGITRLTKYSQGGAQKLVKDFQYDGLNRLKAEITQDVVNGVTQKTLRKDYTYATAPDTNGLFWTTVTSSDGNGGGIGNHVATFYYNGSGQYVQTRLGVLTDSPITVEKVSYDEFGRKQAVEDGIGVKSTYLYDGAGRIKRVNSLDKNGALKAFQEMFYDDAARTVTELTHDLTSGSEKITGKTITHLNKSGKVEQVDQYPEATGTECYVTRYTYNLADQVTSMTDPRNQTLRYSYGYFGLKKLDYPGTLRDDDIYEYNHLDKARQVKKQVALNSYIVTDYDELDRAKKITYPDGRVQKNYYDFAGRLWRTTLVSTTQSTEILYEYDLTGNVKKARHTYNGTIFEIGYAYDEKGNVTSITYPGGFTVNYEYDQYDRVIRIPQFVAEKPAGSTGTGGGTDPKPGSGENPINDPNPGNLSFRTTATAAATTLPGVEYLTNGFMKVLRYANGVTTTYTDDTLGRMQAISNPAFNVTYSYDAKGNVTSMTGQNGTNFSATYMYNDLDWLKEARQGQDTYVYDYDAAGNCTKKTINAAQTTYVYNPAELNLLTSINGITVAYDTRGNMIGRENGYTYTYDTSNQLTQVMKNSQDCGRYFYNSEGKRYKKVENGQSTYAIYSGERLLCEVKPDGTYVYYIYLNNAQVAKVERKNGVDSKYFYHTDNLGSTRAVSDAQGNVVGRVSYEPYGLDQPTGKGDNTLSFTGKMQDDPSGLYYFNARYYDPVLGRFITEDPARDGGNWYVYCAGNPLKCVDVDGKKLVILNAAQGIEAHKVISNYAKSLLVKEGAYEIRINRPVAGDDFIPVSCKRPDIAAYYDDSIEMYEIKQGITWGLNGKNLLPARNFKKGLNQLQDYIDLLPGSIAGTNLPVVMVIPFPELGKDGKLYCYTYPTAVRDDCSAFGMIYYYADDGKKDEKKESFQSVAIPQIVSSSNFSPDLGLGAVSGLIIGAGLVMGGGGYGGGGVPLHTY